MKRCIKCGGTGPFAMDRARRDGLRSDCRVCHRASSSAWYAANPKKAAETKAAYRAANPEKMRALNAAWAKDNRVKKRAAAHRRRAKIRGATVEHFNVSDCYDRDGWKCLLCMEPIDPALRYPHPMSVSEEHIICLAKGGAHTFENTTCSHRLCNLKKGTKHWSEVSVMML